jgi:hypothetical protein
MSSRASRRNADTRVVALLTDFGSAGHHAGVLRGVVLGQAPRVRLVDLCNGVPAGDVDFGAWTLRWSWRYFPAGTVHLAVVDPGVGTPRHALAAAAGGQFFVGPDNGLLSRALSDAGNAAIVSLAPPDGARGVSSTFHGRDLFAPVAARLALGEPLGRLGSPATDWVRLPEPLVRRTGRHRLQGQVIAVDHWGNLVTSVTEGDLAQAGIDSGATVRIGRRSIRGLSRTYADEKVGRPVALINSNGHLEIAVNCGRADALLGATRGAVIGGSV